MRIGFVTTLLWHRYGPFWWDLAADAGADPVRSDPAAVRAAMDDTRVAHVPALAFRAAAADAISLQDCDLVVAPDLNPNFETGRGAGQDPWIVSFPAALATSVSGVPPVFGVPVGPSIDDEPSALEFLRAVDRDPTRVRRVWERHRARPRMARRSPLRWQVSPSTRRTVGVVGPPWLMGTPLLAALADEREHLVGQHQLDPVDLRDEGARYDPDLLPTDAEAVGGARLFGRRGAVATVRAVIDPEIGSDAWLLRRIQDVVREDVEVVSFRELHDPLGILLSQDR